MRGRTWLWGLVLMSARPGMAAPAPAPPEALSTPALELRLSTSPYRFEVVERATGATLLRQQRTEFITTRGTRRVVAARAAQRTPAGLSASLQLSGSADTPTVEFSFP